MGLQVWLPLNGNLKNKGLDSAEGLTIANSVTYSIGHGGYCLNTNGVKSATGHFANLEYLEKYSFSLWIKVSSDSPTSWADIINIGTNHDGNLGGIRIEHTGTAGQAQIVFNKSSNSGNNTVTYYSGGSIGANASDKWAHIVITNDGININSYLNGTKLNINNILVSNIYPVGSLTGDIILGASGAKGYLSDVRIYDHILSKKEIKELSKGLMLHWDFNQGSYEEVTNILNVPAPGASITTAKDWDQTLHLKAINVSGWGHGYNSGVANPTTGYHAHWEDINGISTMVFPKLNYAISDLSASRWLGISESDKNHVSQIGASTTYTISFEAMADTEGRVIHGGYYYSINGTSRGFHDGYFYANNIPVGKWKRYAFTFTTSASLNTGLSGYFYFYGMNGSNGTAYARNLQVEVGEICHDVISGTKEKETIIYDASGFQHNGIITGTLTSAQSNVNTDVDYSRNYDNKNYFANFNGSTYICYDGNLPIPDEYTIAFWLNRSSGGHIVDWRAGDAIGVQPAYIDASSGKLQYYSGAGGGGYFNYVFNTNTWYHIAIAVNATTASLYVNGVKQQTLSATMPTDIEAKFHVGCRVSYTNIPTMKMRDLRLYSTVLSDDNINELYGVPFAIDKEQNIYIRELREGSGE